MTTMLESHRLVKRAIRAGELEREACETCGDPATVAHHDDYSKPLEVRWLCHSHHRLWHSENGAAPNRGDEAMVTFWLEPDLKTTISQIATAEERTVSALMRLLVRERIAKETT